LASASGPTGQRREQSPGEGLRVDAEVLAEAAILAGDQRIDEVGRQLPEGHRGRVVGPTGGHELAAGADDAHARLAVVRDEPLRVSEFQGGSRRGDGGSCSGQARKREEAAAVEQRATGPNRCDFHA
jgi:hypothetical protein